MRRVVFLLAAIGAFLLTGGPGSTTGPNVGDRDPILGNRESAFSTR
jgi:hypothetical protein